MALPSETDRCRLARQHLQTSRLLGLDFVPMRSGHASVIEPPPGEGPATGPAPPPPGQHGAGTAAQLTLGAGQVEPELEPQRKAEALEALARRHDAECEHCTRATAHTRTVFGEGDPDADLMFVGEAPGEDEDRTGRPFVGRAGRKLDEIIRVMRMAREAVYIANLLKSRPPENRTPLPDEVERCTPCLVEQIRIIRPRVIVALGSPAAKWLLRTSDGITRLRGQWGTYVDADAGLSIPVMPTFHPAYLLRNYTIDTRTKMWSDMQAVMAALGPGKGPAAMKES